MALEPLQLCCRLEVALRHDAGATLGRSRIDLHLRLDAQQDRVVHDVQAAQEVSVLANRFVYCLTVLLRQVYLLHVVLVPQEVLILEGRRALETTLDISAVMASLQVVDASDLVLVVEA